MCGGKSCLNSTVYIYPCIIKCNLFSRQQTYYIFHAGTQTFEPITIAEFLDQPVAEEGESRLRIFLRTFAVLLVNSTYFYVCQLVFNNLKKKFKWASSNRFMLQWLHDKQQQQKLKAQGPWSFNWVFPFLDPYAVQNSTLFVPWNVFIHEVTMCSGYAFLLAWCLLHHNCPTLKQDKGSGSGIFNRKLVYMFKLVKNNCNCYNCHQQQQHLYYLLIFFLRGKFYLCNSFIYSSFIESGSGFSIGKYGCLRKIIKN